MHDGLCTTTPQTLRLQSSQREWDVERGVGGTEPLLEDISLEVHTSTLFPSHWPELRCDHVGMQGSLRTLVPVLGWPCVLVQTWPHTERMNTGRLPAVSTTVYFSTLFSFPCLLTVPPSAQMGWLRRLMWRKPRSDGRAVDYIPVRQELYLSIS